MAVSGSGEIKLRDIYNEQQAATGEPSANTNISMDSLADSFGASAASTVTSRATLSGDQDKITDFYGATFPGTFENFAIYRGSYGSNQLDGIAANDDNSVVVEGETIVPYASTTQALVGAENATFEIMTIGGASLSSVQSDDSQEAGGGAASNTYQAASIQLSPDNDTYDGTSMKFRVYDTNNTFNGNFGDQVFRFYDDIDTHTTSQIGPAGSLSATKIMYVDAADESVGTIDTNHTTTIGTIRSSSYSNAINENGDGDNINYTEDLEGAFTIGNTPGKMTFSYTHWNYPYSTTSGGSRNTSTNTAVLDIRYNNAIDSLAIDDTTINVSSVDGANNATFTCYSEGYSGTLTIGYDDNATASDTTYTNTTEAVSTLYVRESISKNFTISSAGTYYPKAHHGGNAVVGSSFIVAPALAYTTTNNQTINVSTTQAFAASVSAGTNASVAVTSSPDIGSGTTTATMTPLLKTGDFTISYAGTADYSQTNNQTDILSVDPTLSVSLADNQGGNNFPINDAHSDTITSGTHGVSPTVFTHTPTAVGTLQNGNALTYLWTSAGSNFTYTSGTVSTAGAVSFKKNSSGTLSHSLTVTGDDDRDASDSSSVVCQSVTKTVAGSTSDVLRIGTTFTVTSISTAYTQTVALYRQNSLDGWDKIANGVSVASTINFSLTGDAWIPDATARAVRLVDDDNTGIYAALGNFAILNVLPVINDFTATASTVIGRIDLAWTTTSATTVSINQSVGSQGSMDGSTSKTGIANNTSMTFTITAGNANSETVTATASATTLNPTITLGAPDISSWTWGDSGNVTLVAQKNFSNALDCHMGYDLTTASGTSGTELQTITAGSGTVNIDFNVVFEKNNWTYASSLGSAITDFRVGNSSAAWVVRESAATVSDFATPNDATNLSATGTSGTAIFVNWDDPSGTFTGVQVYGAPEGIGASQLGSNITNGQASQYSHTGLNDSQPYVYYIRAYYSRTANGVTRTNYNSSGTVTGNVIGWTTEVVYGSTMSPTGGTGWSDSGVSSAQEDAYNGQGGNSSTLHHLTSQVLGTHDVTLHRTEDGTIWDGNDTWFSTGETPDVLYITSAGVATAATYIAGANAKPDAPANGTATANSTSQITLGWTCGSSIEDSFKIFRSTSSYPSTSGTLIATTAANATSYVNASLDDNEQYYYSIYSYNGTTYSSVRATATATTPISPTVDSFSAAASVTNGQIDITWTTSNIGQVTLYSSANNGMTSASTLFDSTASSKYDWTHNDTSLGNGTTRYYQLRVIGNGEIVYSSIVTATTNAAATAWSSVPSDFYMEHIPFATEYSAVKTITLANGSGNTTVSQTGGVQVALSTSGDPGTSGTGNSGTGFATSKSISHTTGTLYMRFKFEHPKAEGNFNSDVTITNNSVSNTALDIDVTTAGGS